MDNKMQKISHYRKSSKIYSGFVYGV